MPNTKRSLSLVGAILVLASFAGAASIAGTVTGPDGAPFMGAFVQAQNGQTKITVNVLSHKDGKYDIAGLPAGEYQLRVRAIGYQTDPRLGVHLKANQKISLDWALQKGSVRWRDLTLYQGEHLLPDLPGKEMMFGPTATGARDAPCQICHGFQSRMASTLRDQAGWRDRVDYMRSAMHAQLHIDNVQEGRIVSFLTALFSENSVLPGSPADLPGYKELVRNFDESAMNIVYVEYDLAGPNRMPWSAIPDKDGIVWMPFYGKQNTIGRLNPQTGETKEFTLPDHDTALLHSVFPAPDGSVWGAEFGTNKLARLDPQTTEITEYQDAYLPGKEGTIQGGSKHTVRVGTDGIAWSSGFPISRFDPKTGEFKHFEDGTYGVTLDKDNNCWFTEYSAVGKIGRIDQKTLKEQTWTPPTDGRAVYSRRIQVDTDGTIWFSESGAGQIGHFNPKSETFQQYQLPGPNPSPYAMNLDGDHHIWYSSEYLDEVGRLDPATGKVVEYPFPHNEITSREYFLDRSGRMWYATPSNNKVGYFYLAHQ